MSEIRIIDTFKRKRIKPCLYQEQFLFFGTANDERGITVRGTDHGWWQVAGAFGDAVLLRIIRAH
jgi:hypothetical protein